MHPLKAQLAHARVFCMHPHRAGGLKRQFVHFFAGEHHTYVASANEVAAPLGQVLADAAIEGGTSAGPGGDLRFNQVGG